MALAPTGRIVRLGTEERLFNRHQRRAFALRDGACIIPGCGVPAGWCEVHHVTDHAKGGPTHTDNGVLLCWWHHRFIDTGPGGSDEPGRARGSGAVVARSLRSMATRHEIPDPDAGTRRAPDVTRRASISRPT